jgi:hypothetical protein
MKKRIIAFWIGCFFIIKVQAQFTLQPMVSTVGLVQKQQLWNVLIVNVAGIETNGKLSLVLRDRTTGQELFTALTGLVPLPKGPKQFNANSLNPIQYNWLSANFSNTRDGLLPIGSYTACYILSGKFNEVLAEECISFDVEALSPPQLIFPADSAVLEEMPNVFSWIPPTPSTIFSTINYQFILTEVKEGQKQTEAIQENMPYQFEPTLKQTSYAYPTSAIKLEKGKWYAWQVVVSDGNKYAAKTETWVFSIKDKPTESKNTNRIYFLLNESNGIYETKEDSLFVKYQSFEKNSEANFYIATERGVVLHQYYNMVHSIM